MTLLPPTNEVYEGNVFTGVCLSTGGGVLSLSRGVSVWGVSVQGSVCPGRCLSRGCLSRESLSKGGLCPGGSLFRGLFPVGLCLGESLSGGLCHKDLRSVMSSWQYTSYWNAFLLFKENYIKSSVLLLSANLPRRICK